jgi:hypothetical protein
MIGWDVEYIMYFACGLFDAAASPSDFTAPTVKLINE